MGYVADPNNLLPIAASGTPPFNTWYGFNGTLSGSPRTGNGDGSLTLENASQIISNPVNNAGVYPTGIPVTAGLPYTFSVAVVGASSAGPSNWQIFVLWVNSSNAVVSTITISTSTFVGTKIRIPLTGVAPVGAVKSVVRISTDRACILTAPVFSQSSVDLGPLPPSYSGSKWTGNPINLIPVSPVDGSLVTMEGWAASNYVTKLSAGGDGKLDIPVSGQASIAFKEVSGTTTTTGIPVLPNTNYDFGITESSFSSLSAAAYLVRKETNGNRTLIPMTYSANGRWSATATSTAGQGFAIQIASVYNTGTFSHPTFVSGTVDPGPKDPVLFNGTWQPTVPNLIPVDPIDGGFARMKYWKTAIGDSVVDNGDNTDTITPGLVPVAVDNGDGTFSITPIPQGAVDNGDGTFTVYPQYSPVLSDNNDGTVTVPVGTTTAYLINADEIYVLTGVNGSVTAGITLSGSSTGATPTTVNLKIYDASAITLLATLPLPRTSNRRSLAFTTPASAGYVVVDALSSSVEASQFTQPTLVAGSADFGPLDPTISGPVNQTLDLIYSERSLAKITVGLQYSSRATVSTTNVIQYADLIKVATITKTLQWATRTTVNKIFVALYAESTKVPRLGIFQWAANTVVNKPTVIQYADLIKITPKVVQFSWAERVTVQKSVTISYADNQIVTSPGNPIQPNPPNPLPPNPAYTSITGVRWANRTLVRNTLAIQYQDAVNTATTVTVNKTFSLVSADRKNVNSSCQLQWSDRTLVSPPDSAPPIDPATKVFSWATRVPVKSTFDLQWQDINIPIDSGIVVTKVLTISSKNYQRVATTTTVSWQDISVQGGQLGNSLNYGLSWSNRVAVKKTLPIMWLETQPVKKTLEIDYTDCILVRKIVVGRWTNTQKIRFVMKFLWGNLPPRKNHRVSQTTFSGSSSTAIGRPGSYALDFDGTTGRRK